MINTRRRIFLFAFLVDPAGLISAQTGHKIGSNFATLILTAFFHLTNNRSYLQEATRFFRFLNTCQ